MGVSSKRPSSCQHNHDKRYYKIKLLKSLEIYIWKEILTLDRIDWQC